MRKSANSASDRQTYPGGVGDAQVPHISFKFGDLFAEFVRKCRLNRHFNPQKNRRQSPLAFADGQKRKQRLSPLSSARLSTRKTFAGFFLIFTVSLPFG